MEINNYPKYLIYPDGRVYNQQHGRFLKPGNNGTYLTTSLSRSGTAQIFLTHRLLAEHYLENPENKPQVDHINGNPTDCRLDNLRWVTRRENATNRRLSSNNSSGHSAIRGVPLKCGLTSYRATWTEKGKRTSKSFPELQAAINFRNQQLVRLGLSDYIRA